ncbi:MAG: cupin domain-containing protein [Gammaproteobacteria bacterium]|jgi:quercetin dioxygenase-like cupin family protein|nr:cupin domain-containing protein [Gammaproteobacteria bacterium]
MRKHLLLPAAAALAVSGFIVAGMDAAIAGDQARVTAPDDPAIEWGPCPGFFPDTCRIGVLHGNPAEPRADIFFKVPANTDLPAHTHTSAERMVLVSGRMRVDYEGQAPAVIETGSYAYGPPGRAHSARCLDAGECVLFIAFNEPIDAIPVEEQTVETND